MSQSDQVLRTGVLFKKGSGAGPFGRRNWKPRYFVLTPAKLRYYTFEDGDLKGEVDLSGCDEGMIEVMPMDSMKTGSSASTIWRIAVNAPERRLLVAAGTEMEMNDWVDKLMMAFRISHGQPMHLPSRGSLSQAPPSGVGSNYSADRATAAGGAGMSITDFQNFTVARRTNHGGGGGGGGRQSFGAGDAHRLSASFHQSEQPRKHSVRKDESAAAAMQLQEMEADELRREELDRERAYQVEQTRRFEEAKRAEAQAEAARRREEVEAEEARRYHEEALRQQQQEEEEQQRLALEMQLLTVEREREEERARADAEQQKRNQEAALDEQRRRKREKHERERAAREQQIREQEHQEMERRRSEARHDSGEEFDLDDSSDEDIDGTAAPAAPPRSSLIGDVKREAMMKQQAAHQRHREAALREEQRRQRDVEVPPRVVEVTRRAPPPAAPSAAHASRASPPKIDSFEL